MRRKAILAAVITLVMLIPSFTYAETECVDSDIVTIDNEYYLETVIEDDDSTAKSIVQNLMSRGKATKTQSKTTYCKNSSGKVMWYVRVTGTFTYGNGSAKCTKSVCTAESKNKTWKVSGRSASKSGNKASASAKGTHYLNGAPVETISKTVTLKCSPTGDFS